MGNCLLKRLSDQRLRHQPTAFESKYARVGVGVGVDSKNGVPVINDTDLAALTLLVAESDPKQKETLIRLLMYMLKQAD